MYKVPVFTGTSYFKEMSRPENTAAVGIKNAVEKLKRQHRILIDLTFFKVFTHE